MKLPTRYPYPLAAGLALAGMGLLYAWALARDAGLRYPSPLEAFTVLMVLDAGAHVAAPLLASPRRAQAWFFAGQILLVLAISAFARDLLVAGGLDLLLMGEAVFFLRSTGGTLLVAATVVASFVLTAWWLGGTSLALTALASLALPLSVVVGGVLLLARQIRARGRGGGVGPAGGTASGGAHRRP